MNRTHEKNKLCGLSATAALTDFRIPPPSRLEVEVNFLQSVHGERCNLSMDRLLFTKQLSLKPHANLVLNGEIEHINTSLPLFTINEFASETFSPYPSISPTPCSLDRVPTFKHHPHIPIDGLTDNATTSAVQRPFTAACNLKKLVDHSRCFWPDTTPDKSRSQFQPRFTTDAGVSGSTPNQHHQSRLRILFCIT